MADVLPAVVTVTSTDPAVPGGAVAVMDVPELTVASLAGLEPKSTVAPFAKLVPVIVTTVPPPSGPAAGLTFVTVGVPAAEACPEVA